ncbi:NAD-dependent epimerase/dehydratase [Legionella beliardensis]|uniref:NAD-dependent epimerase/dehydratase n=1 Tax=Legionella beliardensis TaxID=91822 RepID=A0A378IBS5_9GAMM|nr:NAD-dependent epimerase/dehydratase family protein [Legionella beliardensis]STX29744.1 NAD-dependent epimerase/dehydratase [Legionella beliardensis]
MNVLITGGAGFIGSHIVEFHLSRGDTVYVIDNLSTGSLDNIKSFMSNQKFHFDESDILNSEKLIEFIRKADRIYHMAAMVGMYHLLAHPIETLITNITGCERILRIISQYNFNARVLVASSSEIYGPTHHQFLKEDDLLPFKSAAHSKWVYATSKFTDEIFSLAYARAKNMKVTVLRLFNTIGPRQNGIYGMVVPRFIEQAIKDEPITVYGTGEQTRSFCDVRDTVAALDLIACNENCAGEVLNVGQDQCVTINQIAKMIITLSNSGSDIRLVPYKEAYGQEYEDIMHRRPDLKKFYHFTQYKFRWNLQDTLLDLIQAKRKALSIEW